MIFLSMDLENFRQFHGDQTITFASGRDKNVTIINGANGAGKTSLFTALNWCLYDEGAEGIGALVSKEEALDREFGAEIVTKVTVWFAHGGRVYAAIRRVAEKKVKRKGPILEGDEAEPSKYRNFILERLPADETDFTVLVEKNDNMVPVPDPHILIDTILPKNARKYFLFDGEKIEQLTKPDHDNEVRDAVRNVLQLPTIERTRDHLATVLRELTKETKKNSAGNEEEYYQAIAEAEESKEQIADELVRLEGRLKSTRHLKQQVAADLSKHAGIKHLIERRKDLENQFQIASEHSKSLNDDLRALLSSSYVIIAEPFIKNALKYLKEKKDKKQIPPPVQQTFIDSILESAKCICGNKLHEGSEGRRCIEDFMKKTAEFSNTSQLLSDLYNDLQVIDRISHSTATNINTNVAQILKINENLENLRRRIEDIHNELKDHPQIDTSILEKKRYSLEQEERTISAKIAEKDANLKGCDLFIKDIQKKLELIAKSKKAVRKYLINRQLAEKALDVISVVYEDFAKKKREEIEEKLKELFSSLIWKETQFPIVGLTDDYKLEVYDLYGSPAREELSAGERQVLSLAFITAMAFTSGGRVPLVMDTPFGRLHSVHRKNIVKSLPSHNRQCIFLVQDEELRGEPRRLLKERVGYEYDLNFDAGVTTIGEV